MGLARSTVSARVDALLAADLLMPAGEGNSSGGRPPALVAFNPRAKAAIGVDLGAAHGLVTVCDLAGRVLASKRRDLSISSGPEVVLEWVVSASNECLKESGFERESVLGVGIGLPGPVEHSTGKPYKPPIMSGWDGFDVPSFMRERLCDTVLVDNDVNMLAVGERATVWTDIEDLVFLKVATGIGAGIISGGKLQRGAQGTAGDVGHVQVPFTQGTTRQVGDERDLEAIAGGTALAASLAELGYPAETTADVVKLLRDGHGAAIQLVRQAGREVGEVLAAIVNILNPSVLVIGGSIGNEGEHLIAGVREVVYRRSTPLATQYLQIVQSRAGVLGGALGAAHMVIEDGLGPEKIDTIVTA
jgi:glucokinase